MIIPFFISKALTFWNESFRYGVGDRAGVKEKNRFWKKEIFKVQNEKNQQVELYEVTREAESLEKRDIQRFEIGSGFETNVITGALTH